LRADLAGVRHGSGRYGAINRQLTDVDALSTNVKQ
jgi:hypothetical protein